MPRFRFETDVVSGAQLDAVVRLAQLRFPEVTVELLRPVHDGRVDRVQWECRAPSRVHVDRWASLAGLATSGVRATVDASEPHPRGDGES